MLMRIIKVVVVLLVLGVGLAGLLSYRAYESAHAPYKGYTDKEVFFAVDRGAAGTHIGRALAEKGIIEDARLFVAALRLRGETGALQAGEYRFAEPLSTLDVLDRLVEGDIYTFPITVPEGLTVVETAEHLAANGLGDARTLAAAFQDTSLIARIDPDAIDLEGYLFPTTYQFTRNPSPAEVADTMISQFDKVFDAAKREKSEELGLSLREVVTLASVIEKETGNAEERPMIGSVVWNRLKRGIPLAMDSTIIYALKLQGTYDGNLRRVDLETAHPYNTYLVAGIPPGPIASPGEASLDAVLEPADTRYLYFVSRNDGSHHFSTTYQEHTNAVRKYQVEYFRQRRQRRNGTGS
jgi:UPF0755 protein